MRWALILLCGLVHGLAAPPIPAPLTAPGQHTLGGSTHGTPFYVLEQGDDTCRAGSGKQYAGKVDVSPEKSLFFWFFESRRSPLSDPVIVWLNGGPGGSSMYGVFREIGGCQMNEFNNDTVYNEDSWANFANVLFINQPAGVGFSTVHGGTVGGPDNNHEAAQDLSTFMDIFFAHVFPAYADLPLHIAGESYGGKYVPGLTHYLATRPGSSSSGAVLRHAVDSIILVDAAVDLVTSGYAGYYDHFCAVDERGQSSKPGGFNASTCAAMERQLPECERLMALCRDTYDVHVCSLAGQWCADHVGKYLLDEMVPGGRNPYDDRRPCETLPMCDDFSGPGYSTYLNSSRVKRALCIPDDFSFDGTNNDLNKRWEASGNLYVPTTREVSYILDQTATRVLVLNGDNDSIINTEGQKRVWEHMTWRRQALYRISKWVDWHWPSATGQLTVGGQLKTADKLSFATILNAGHASPGDQKAAVAFLIQCWTSTDRTGTDKAGTDKDRRCPL